MKIGSACATGCIPTRRQAYYPLEQLSSLVQRMKEDRQDIRLGCIRICSSLNNIIMAHILKKCVTYKNKCDFIPCTAPLKNLRDWPLVTDSPVATERLWTNYTVSLLQVYVRVLKNNSIREGLPFFSRSEQVPIAQVLEVCMV